MNFKVYSKENCPYCYKVKTVLELTGTKFEILKLDEDFTREEFFNIFPTARTFPQIKIDGNDIGGYTELEAWWQNKG